ncbi:hypothetical protein SDC9_98513 [bioreactor metagenome]|uniref:Uncharacterized protein n=1 Tax=bioreactor metagenome TaxID=1076179 RepID=A0A645AEZ0_9ZZZZ
MRRSFRLGECRGNIRLHGDTGDRSAVAGLRSPCPRVGIVARLDEHTACANRAAFDIGAVVAVGVGIHHCHAHAHKTQAERIIRYQRLGQRTSHAAHNEIARDCDRPAEQIRHAGRIGGSDRRIHIGGDERNAGGATARCAVAAEARDCARAYEYLAAVDIVVTIVVVINRIAESADCHNAHKRSVILHRIDKHARIADLIIDQPVVVEPGVDTEAAGGNVRPADKGGLSRSKRRSKDICRDADGGQLEQRFFVGGDRMRNTVHQDVDRTRRRHVSTPADIRLRDRAYNCRRDVGVERAERDRKPDTGVGLHGDRLRVGRICIGYLDGGCADICAGRAHDIRFKRTVGVGEGCRHTDCCIANRRSRGDICVCIRVSDCGNTQFAAGLNRGAGNISAARDIARRDGGVGVDAVQRKRYADGRRFRIAEHLRHEIFVLAERCLRTLAVDVEFRFDGNVSAHLEAHVLNIRVLFRV